MSELDKLMKEIKIAFKNKDDQIVELKAQVQRLNFIETDWTEFRRNAVTQSADIPFDDVNTAVYPIIAADKVRDLNQQIQLLKESNLKIAMHEIKLSEAYDNALAENNQEVELMGSEDVDYRVGYGKLPLTHENWIRQENPDTYGKLSHVYARINDENTIDFLGIILSNLQSGYRKSRERSLAITKVEEAIHWLQADVRLISSATKPDEVKESNV